MIKKLLFIPLMLIMLLLGYVSSVEAYIQDETELYAKIESLKQLRDYDSMALINKAELIGYRLNDFNSARTAYNSSINYAIDQLTQIQNDLASLSTSNIDEQEKFFQRQSLLQKANTVLSNLNIQTNMYIETIKYPMPTLTYEKYRNKFWPLYNSLGF